MQSMYYIGSMCREMLVRPGEPENGLVRSLERDPSSG
jgi:hypothetical protein